MSTGPAFAVDARAVDRWPVSAGEEFLLDGSGIVTAFVAICGIGAGMLLGGLVD